MPPTCQACGAEVMRTRDLTGLTVNVDPETRERRAVVGRRTFPDGVDLLEYVDTYTPHRETCLAQGLFPEKPTSSEHARELAERAGDSAGIGGAS